MQTQFDYMQMTLDDLDSKVERLDEAIRGNGDVGLVTQVALLDRRLRICEEFVVGLNSLKRWLALGILALFGSLAWRVLEWFLTNEATA